MSETWAPKIAIIGMAGRFPGGGGLTEFWASLADGQESLTRFTRQADDGVEELEAAHGIVPDGDLFDAEFFGYAPSEALLIDPQQLVFLECAWEALEHAGYDPSGYDGAVGIYAGGGDTGYLEQLREHQIKAPDVSELQVRLASSADFLTSRVAYKIGLRGPAITVQTACSTSLVAVHMAVQSLLAGDCDLALAGGITLHVPLGSDELVSDQPGEDGIIAADGHCRPFDADASGTVASDGAGIVVLKRLEEALADGDHVHAVILGSAVTNDGSTKVGFTAPSVAGIAAAVSAAHAVANVDPGTIDYVEAHGTGTPVGDPIEVRGLANAFAGGAEREDPIVLGTVKANIGHTDVAAGVLGLIKVVLSLGHEQIPATLHFSTPNPAADLPSSPFVVRAETGPWPESDSPRRADVNSMGLGGTNANVVVEEAPAEEADGESPWAYQLLPLAARTPAALSASARRLGSDLRAKAATPLADIAWTLQAGRHPFGQRGFVVAESQEDAVAALLGEAPGRLVTSSVLAPPQPSEAVFLFPGQGSQHPGMADDLYRCHRGFRADLDTCADLAAAALSVDLRSVLLNPPDEAAEQKARAQLTTMTVTQPAVFAVEYALARLWQSWGVRPVAVTGHSLGAYAAAAIAGVLSLPDAMTLVLERARLLNDMPAGAMLAVPMSAAELESRLTDDLSIAAINGPNKCVLTGPIDAISTLQNAIAADGIDCRVLHISAAAHSHLVEPAIDAFEKKVTEVTLKAPEIPWISDRTGRPVSADEATSPAYWSGHLRHTVNFAAVLGTVFEIQNTALVEVGPGRTLTGLARQHPACPADLTVVPSMPHPADDVAGQPVLLGAAGQLWQAGVQLDWAAVHAGERRRRVPLPTYPFERRRFRLDQGLEASSEGLKDADAASSPEPAAPGWSTTTEQAVARAYQSVLGIDQADGHRSFFDLGGDSMLAARVAAILRQELDVQVGVRSVFRAPTIIGLASLIEEQHSDEN